MARLNTVKSFRGTTKTEDGKLTCGKCRNKINKGDAYRWWANRLPGARGSVRQIRCSKSECSPSQADMTPGRAGDLLRLQEDGHNKIDAATSIDDLRCIAETLADEVQQMADELGESSDNIEEGFGHETQQSAELRERSDNMENYADELCDVDLEEADESEDEIRSEIEEMAKDDDSIDVEAEVATRIEEHLEEQRDKVREMLDAVDIY